MQTVWRPLCAAGMPPAQAQALIEYLKSNPEAAKQCQAQVCSAGHGFARCALAIGRVNASPMCMASFGNSKSCGSGTGDSICRSCTFYAMQGCQPGVACTPYSFK